LWAVACLRSAARPAVSLASKAVICTRGVPKMGRARTGRRGMTVASTAGTPYGDYQTEERDEGAAGLDPPRERNKWKIATIALAGVAALAVVGVGMSLLGQSTRMSHSEVVAQEHRLTSIALLKRANQDAVAEKQAVAAAVAKQKAHD